MTINTLLTMSTIISIGGGSIAEPKEHPETTEIDLYIVKKSKKNNPHVLFIPTASEDSEGYIEAFKKQYGERLGCRVDTLLLFKDRPTKKGIAEKIAKADIIYVGGGNTLRMMKLWRKLGVDLLLKKAYKRGAVCCGLSAGAICWFREGNSDSWKYSRPEAPYIRVKCLDFVDALLCPHFDGEADRQPSLKKMMKKVSGIAITLDNCAAIEIEDGRYNVITSKKTAKMQKVYWEKGEYVIERLSEGRVEALVAV